MQNFFEKSKKRQKFIYTSGDRFGRLTLTGLTYTKTMWGVFRRIVEAVCDCGVVKEYFFSLLANGDTQSCGCYRREASKKKMTTHNLSGHKLYDVWQQMVLRCYNQNHVSFKNYGGRNIEVWADWKDDFLEFYDWCLANGYEENLSLDREDNDGNYAPYNCRFITQSDQNRNRRNNIMITAFGETKCLWDWAKDTRCKVSSWGLRNRYDRGKWTDMEKMISSPNEERKSIQRNNKRSVMLTAFGETKCMSAWLEDSRCTVKIDSFRDRLLKGWTHEKVISFPARVV